MRIVFSAIAVVTVVIFSGTMFCFASKVNLAVQVVEKKGYQTINDFDYSALSGQSSTVVEINNSREKDRGFISDFAFKYIYNWNHQLLLSTTRINNFISLS